jgi:hypothetical protein
VGGTIVGEEDEISIKDVADNVVRALDFTGEYKVGPQFLSALSLSCSFLIEMRWDLIVCSFAVGLEPSRRPVQKDGFQPEITQPPARLPVHAV